MIYEFTDEIPENNKLSEFNEPENWNEREAKEKDSLCCHDCRFFLLAFPCECSTSIGKYHKTCNNFKWW
jgi:hypothetical protein